MRLIIEGISSLKSGNLLAAFVLLLIISACDVHEFPKIDEPTPPEPPQPEATTFDFALSFGELEMPTYTILEYDADRGELTQSRSVEVKTSNIVKVFTDPEADTEATNRTGSRAEVSTIVLTGGESELTADRQFKISLKPGCYIVAVWSHYTDGISGEEFTTTRRTSLKST